MCIRDRYTVASLARCSEIWQWNTVYSTKHGNDAAAHARKLLQFSVKNELGLEITSAISVPNLVKIYEKLRLLSLTKDKNFVIPLLHVHWLNPFRLQTLPLERRLSGRLHSKFAEDRLKIEGARDYRMHRLRCDPNARTHSNKHNNEHTGVTHEWKSTANIVCPVHVHGLDRQQENHAITKKTAWAAWCRYRLQHYGITFTWYRRANSEAIALDV